MNIVRWNPFRGIDEVLDRYMLPVSGVFAENAHDWRPLVDIRETEDAYRLDLELPAIDPKDVNITLQDGVLRVSGERHFASEDESGRLHRSERRYGKFTRSFGLPDDADPDAIRASAKDGVISISVGKSAKASPRSIEIEAS